MKKKWDNDDLLNGRMWLQAAQLRVEKTDGRRTGERHFTSLVDTAVYTK